MVTVIRVPIKSIRAEANPRPWFNMEWDGVQIQVGKDNNGFGKAQKGSHPTPISKNRCRVYRGQTANAEGDKYIEMEWVFCMLMDGEYSFRPSSELPSTLMAHLGFYNPVTNILRLLEFQEE